MNYGIDYEHRHSAPARVGPKSTGPIQATAPGGSGVDSYATIWSATGWWAHCDVYLLVPGTWTDVVLRLYSLTGGVRSLVHQTTVAMSGVLRLADGSYEGVMLRGRGHPGSGWAVTATNPAAAINVDEGTIAGELWGCEAAEPGDPGGHVVVVTPEVLTASSFGAANQAAIGSGVVHVVSASLRNNSASDRYLQLFEAAAAVPDGTVPRLSWYVPTGALVVIGDDALSLGGLRFSPGARWAFSSTEAVLTGATAADAVVQVVYR